ncbi:MAG: hypothetical protein ACPL8I_11495 [Chloroflexaceae bacterium]
MAMIDTVDRFFARLLRVPLPPQAVAETCDAGVEGEVDSAPATRAFGLSLLISGLRCTLQYIILPVVLPLIGFATDLALPLVILLDLVALTLLVRSLRYFWAVRHPRRFDMLPLSAVILLIILLSLGFDLWRLVA